MREALTTQTTSTAHATGLTYDAQRTLVLPQSHAALVTDADGGLTARPSQPQPSAESWSALTAASADGWCVYPSYRTSFQFDQERYEREYMPANQTCATWHAAQQAQAQTDRLATAGSVSVAVEPPIPFDLSVDPHGVLSISGCVGGRLSYSLEHDAGPLGTGAIRPQDGGWPPSLAGIQPLPGDQRPLTVLLPYPSSFVFVWCDTPTATAGSSEPKFLPVHTPVPESILRTRPASRQRRAQDASTGSGSSASTDRSSASAKLRRNIVVLELDALSAKMLPLLMPRTYALLESMRQTPEREHQAEVGSSASSPSVSGAPSHTVSYRFTRTSLSGTNSIPSFLSLFGGGCYASMPAPDSPEWLWNTARSEGYTTGFGENYCSFGKYAVAGLDARSLPPPGTVPRMDYNALLPVCHLPLFPAEGWRVEAGPRCVGEKPTWEVTLEPLRLALARQSAALQHSSSDPLASHPLLYSQVLMEAHEPSGFLARHMDSSGFPEALEQMLGSPALQNGIVVLYSDHGVHYGPYSFASAHGAQEHLEPFLYLLAPRGGPGALTASEQRLLQLNGERLTSPYDWHKTLMALIRDDGGEGGGETEDAAAAPPAPRAYNLLRDSVPADRACEQLPNEVLDDFWNPSRQMAPLCLCESPFTRVCRTRPADLAPSIWNECTQLWGHPLVFDAEFYASLHREGILLEQEKQLHGWSLRGHQRDGATPLGVEFSPCVALHHWCTRGVYLGLQSSPSFHLRALVTHHPTLALQLQDPLSFVRQFIRENHALRPAPRTLFPPPSSPLPPTQPQPAFDLLAAPPSHFAAFTGVSLSVAQVAVQHQLREVCGEPPSDPGALVWLRAITMQSVCEEDHGADSSAAAASSTSSSAAASATSAPRAVPVSAASVSRLSPLQSASLLADSRWQCYHWCVFDLPSASESSPSAQSAIAGWEVTGGACLQRFTSSGAGSNSVCVTQFSELKAEALQLRSESSATQLKT